MDLTFLAATGFAAFGFMVGAMVEERLWHLLSRPLPRPWRPVLRYLAPGTVWRDIGRLLETGRWT